MNHELDNANWDADSRSQTTGRAFRLMMESLGSVGGKLQIDDLVVDSLGMKEFDIRMLSPWVSEACGVDISPDRFRELANRIAGARGYVAPEAWSPDLSYDGEPLDAEDWGPFGRLTWRDLASAISETVGPSPFKRVRIFGRDCLPAGVFFGLRCLMRKPIDDSRRIGPSTGLMSSMKLDELRSFWKRAQLHVEHLPSIRTSPWAIVAGLISFAGGVAALPAGVWALGTIIWLVQAICTNDGWTFLATGTLAAMTLAAGALSALLFYCAAGLRRANFKLPGSVITFKDMARLIASLVERNEAAARSAATSIGA